MVYSEVIATTVIIKNYNSNVKMLCSGISLLYGLATNQEIIAWLCGSNYFYSEGFDIQAGEIASHNYYGLNA